MQWKHNLQSETACDIIDIPKYDGGHIAIHFTMIQIKKSRELKTFQEGAKLFSVTDVMQ